MINETETKTYNFNSKTGTFINKSGSFPIHAKGLFGVEYVLIKKLTFSITIEKNYLTNSEYANMSWTCNYHTQNKNGEFAKRDNYRTIANESVDNLIGADNRQRLETEIANELLNQLTTATDLIFNKLNS